MPTFLWAALDFFAKGETQTGKVQPDFSVVELSCQRWEVGEFDFKFDGSGSARSNSAAFAAPGWAQPESEHRR